MSARSKTVKQARQLRRTMTPPEITLWQFLRTRPDGHKFRRQHPVGPYILDFYCPAVRLAIEIDGIAHEMGDNPARDEQRDAWLSTQNISTLRISAADVMSDLDAVSRLILHRCALPLHRLRRSPSPSDDGEE